MTKTTTRPTTLTTTAGRRARAPTAVGVVVEEPRPSTSTSSRHPSSRQATARRRPRRPARRASQRTAAAPQAAAAPTSPRASRTSCVPSFVPFLALVGPSSLEPASRARKAKGTGAAGRCLSVGTSKPRAGADDEPRCGRQHCLPCVREHRTDALARPPLCSRPARSRSGSSGLQACDPCRSRKVKCLRTNGSDRVRLCALFTHWSACSRLAPCKQKGDRRSVDAIRRRYWPGLAHRVRQSLTRYPSSPPRPSLHLAAPRLIRRRRPRTRPVSGRHLASLGSPPSARPHSHNSSATRACRRTSSARESALPLLGRLAGRLPSWRMRRSDYGCLASPPLCSSQRQAS